MTVTAEKTVREVAVAFPEATRIFEKFGIDYCCGGSKSLQQACLTLHLSVDDLIDSLEVAEKTSHSHQIDRDWQEEPLTDLIDHIVGTHHKYTRGEIARLAALLLKVCGVHGKNHPELALIQNTFAALAQELTMHMMKEEMVLFPYISRMEEAVVQKEPVLPPPFGTVENPVAMMIHEHDSAGNALRTIREATRDYTPSADACISYQTLYKALADFEKDLHQHIHLENNILFPRALEMERESQKA